MSGHFEIVVGFLHALFKRNCQLLRMAREWSLQLQLSGRACDPCSIFLRLLAFAFLLCLGVEALAPKPEPKSKQNTGVGRISRQLAAVQRPKSHVDQLSGSLQQPQSFTPRTLNHGPEIYTSKDPGHRLDTPAG